MIAMLKEALVCMTFLTGIPDPGPPYPLIEEVTRSAMDTMNPSAVGIFWPYHPAASGPLIWLSPTAGMAVLAHELTHWAQAIERGIPFGNHLLPYFVSNHADVWCKEVHYDN